MVSSKMKWGLGLLAATGVTLYALRGKIANAFHLNHLETGTYPSGLKKYDYYVWAISLEDAKNKTMAKYPEAAIQGGILAKPGEGETSQYKITFAILG